jgi:hypothetical protein
MHRRLPSLLDAQRILAERRTRPVRRPPPPAGRSLTKFIKALDDRFGQGSDVLRTRWREIAGEVLATRTEPVKLIRSRTGGGGVLEIKVDGPAAALIQHQAPQLMARVNLFLGSGTVAKLRIVQGRVIAPASRAAAATPKRLKNRPLDAAAEARLREGLEKAADGPLKGALLRLGREVLRREGEH